MIQKKFIAEQSYFPDMVKFLKWAFEEINVKEISRKKLLVVSEEILANIISYAYESPADSKIDNYVVIKIFITGKKNISLEFEDCGIEFEFNNYKSGPLKKHQIGGLGIFFVKELSDKVIHERKEDKNILKVVMKNVL